MSETTATVCRITNLVHDLRKSLDSYAYNLDNNQFEMAGIEIGKMVQIGSELSALEGRMTDELWRFKESFKRNQEQE